MHNGSALQMAGRALAIAYLTFGLEFLCVLRRSAVQFVLMSWQPVYRLIKKIPRGRVTTYGDLARTLRLRGGARAVGYAMAACPSGQGIPWHRVVGAGGRLLIPEPHGSLQRRLLESEGVKLNGSRIDMSLFAWSAARNKALDANRGAARSGARRKPARRTGKSRVTLAGASKSRSRRSHASPRRS